MGEKQTLLPHERLKLLREGKTVFCDCCKKGIMQPIGDAKKTNTFECDACKKQMIFN